MTPADHAATEGREGMVTVYDHTGGYLGCMGIETWEWLRDSKMDAPALADRATAAHNTCGTCGAWSGTTSGCEECSEFMQESGIAAKWSEDVEAAEARATELERERDEVRLDRDEGWRQHNRSELKIASLQERASGFPRYCLAVNEDMVCDGPLGHDGGCSFVGAWSLARRLEDELAKITAYAGETTDELRGERERAERAGGRLHEYRIAFTRAETQLGAARGVIADALPSLHGGSCVGTDEAPAEGGPCIRCRVLRAFDRAAL